MKRPAALVTVCTTLGAMLCAGLTLTASPAAAIVNGTLDTTHRSTGALVQVDDLGHLQARCSGFLAAPTVFVTAQHCFGIFRIPDGDPAMVSFDAVITDASPTLMGTAHHNTAVGSTPSSDAHDVGVIVLSAPVTDRTPMNLPRLDELVTFQKSGRLEAHDPIRIVGYGAVNVERPRIFTFANERRTTLLEFQTLQPGFMVSQQKNGGACYGDSGGPNIVTVGGREVVGAITRHLNAGFDCQTTVWSYRLDTPAARAFLGQFLTLP
jgi:hypothetical protein